MALFHTTVVDNQIKALDTIGTAVGSIATFDTDRAERLVNLEVAITATGGGGTPDSPIAINGFSACNLAVNGTTETIPFGQTVYGGSLNVGSGVLTVTHGYILIDGVSETFTGAWGSNTNGYVVYKTITDITNRASSFSNEFTYQYATWQNMALYKHGGSSGASTTVSFCLPDTVTSLASANTWASNNNVQLVYELATPIEIQLDSKQIQAIIGTNNIYADTGDIIELKFVLSVGKAVS